MRLSHTLRPTHPSGTDLLAAAGYTLNLGDGLHTILPIGQRVLHRLNSIIRRELGLIGAHETTMPLLQPADLWRRSYGAATSREEAFGTQIFGLTDRRGRALVLAPSHEEAATVLAAAHAWRSTDPSRIIFQIQPRFRDQDSPPGAGLLQAREFMMADAYSFHSDRDALDEVYTHIKRAVLAVLAACDLPAKVVDADSGAMGGDMSEEVIVELPEGFGVVAVECSFCGYAASREVATSAPVPARAPSKPWLAGRELTGERLQCVPLISQSGITLALARGDTTLNPLKIARALVDAGRSARGLHRATATELAEHGSDFGLVSLVDTPSTVFVLADRAVEGARDLTYPSVYADRWRTDMRAGRDYRVDHYADLTVPPDGAACIRCGKSLQHIRGLELAHLFKIGTGYTSQLGAVADSVEPQPLEMGSYGLGVTRLMAAVVEYHKDTKGIVWPSRIAPYSAIIIGAEYHRTDSRLAEEVYRMLVDRGAEVLLDDTDEPFAVRQNRANLIGIPLHIIIPEAADGTLEIRDRATGHSVMAHYSDIVAACLAGTDVQP